MQSISIEENELAPKVSLRVGHKNCSTSIMDCYFGIHDLPASRAEQSRAIVLFSIPEIGVRFKAPFGGVDRAHCSLASLLALLEFIDSNQKYFSNHTYQIFGNDNSIINQLNGRVAYPDMFEPLIKKAETYREKYRFSLEWIPTSENMALDLFFD